MNDYRVAPFRKYAARVYEWDPAGHDGKREPWEDMEATIDAGWAESLVRSGGQETATGHKTERYTDPVTDRREVTRWAWTLPLEVPADLAARCDVDNLNGYLTYDPNAPEGQQG